jgi:phenylalanyl-tRNA synthetase alpha chain
MINKMKLEEIRDAFLAEIAAAKDEKEVEALRVKYLGRQAGLLVDILRSLKDRSLEEKRTVGREANALRDEMERILEERETEVGKGKYKKEFDLTRPGDRIPHGHLHPLTQVENEVIQMFRSLNFSIIDGPEVETEYYNFDALNIPKNHPAREMWDTFWLKSRNKKDERMLLRTHTSPVQVRYMETHTPPFQILVPGRVFRYEATDATHETNFGQFEGLMVGKNVTIANFRYTIEAFFDKFFRKKIQFRYRPSYFPFVEPGWEVDIKIPGGMGHNEHWLEVMGAGLVHPNVFERVKYNPKEWQGFAFGMSLERLAMIRYNIPDIRLFYSGDTRFISQF